jgi:competence protein ComEC
MECKSEERISKSQIFFFLALAFLTGIFLTSFFKIEKFLILLILAAGVGVFLAGYPGKKGALALVFALFLALGASRTNFSLEAIKNNSENMKLGPVDFVGTIVKEPEMGDGYQKIVASPEKEKKASLGEKILISADAFPGFEYGDKIKVNCVLQDPKNKEDSKFDYRMYLAKDGIYRICNKPQIALVAKNKGNKAYAAILAAKNAFEEKLSAVFPDPEGAYLKGLLLGGNKRMTENLTEAFSKTGTSHTVAVSGYNVTIVAAFLMWLGIFFGLWRQQVFSFALVGIVLFVLATGAPSSAVRAGIMGSLVIWAMKEGRLANSQNAILCAGALMLAVNPLLLRYDAGFQLSFLATLGIVWLYPLFEKIFFEGKQNILKETILMTLAAQFFVLPVILGNFENLSIISPLANLLILPAIPYIMLGGFVAGVAGFLFIPLGKIIGFAPYILLRSELFAVERMAALPWASIEIKNFGWQYVLAYYILLAGLLFFLKKKSRSQASLAQGSPL